MEGTPREEPAQEKIILDSEKVTQCEKRAQELYTNTKELRDSLRSLGLEEDADVADTIAEKMLFLMWRAKGNFQSK